MGKIKKKTEVTTVKEAEVEITIPLEVKTSGIGKMDLDFNSEGLNNIARKINEIIKYIDAQLN